MRKAVPEEGRLVETIRGLHEDSFTILAFMEIFKRLFPDEWQALVERSGLFGEKRRYTVAAYLANRLFTYSQKPESCLVPFRRYGRGRKGDYGRATREERRFFGSPWIAIFRKTEKKET